MHKSTRQTHKPTLKDWKTAKRIMRYLKTTKNLKCHLGGGESTSTDMHVECLSDADFAADKSDRKSVSSCVLNMNDYVVL